MTATCDCSTVCQFDDRFQPATRELMVFTKSKNRYFDLDAVREVNHPERMDERAMHSPKHEFDMAPNRGWSKTGPGSGDWNPAGAPPLDWWLIPYAEPNITPRQGDPMTATFYVGDAIQVMNRLPEKSVDLILTSPPFLALRSYLPADHPDKALEGGSQSTPGQYIDWLLDVVEACTRVLAPHGSLVFELGDTYSGSGGGGGDYLEGGWREGQAQFAGSASSMRESNAAHWRQKNTLKDAWPLAKSLSLIPETFRFAMVYGRNPHTGRTTEPWRLRNVIRWVRPNPPVGALGDKFRPATSELMVFCKAKDRFFDLDAVRSPLTDPGTRTPCEHGRFESHDYLDDPSCPDPGCLRHASTLHCPGGSKPRDYSKEAAATAKRRDDYNAVRAEVGLSSLSPSNGLNNPAGAPPLDWWNIPPGGYAGAHYAVWPPELLIKPIKAMSPEKVCRTCGQPSRRIVERQREVNGVVVQGGDWSDHGVTGWDRDRDPSNGQNTRTLVNTLGWSDCGHGDLCGMCRGTGEPTQIVDFDGGVHLVCPSCHGDGKNFRPGLVLDPFAGSGTTLAVATGHGRDAIGVDLDERNYDLALERVGPFILTRGEVAA